MTLLARALAGNRWHIQIGHFEDVLLKGHFTKVWAELSNRILEGAVLKCVDSGCHYTPPLQGKGMEVLWNLGESCVGGPFDSHYGPWPLSGRELGRKSLISLSIILWSLAGASH